MLAPATVFPSSRNPIASVTFLDPPGRTEGPGDDRTRNRPDQISRGPPQKPRPQIGVEHDHDVPAARAVCETDFLDSAKRESDWCFQPTHRGSETHRKKPAGAQCIDHR